MKTIATPTGQVTRRSFLLGMASAAIASRAVGAPRADLVVAQIAPFSGPIAFYAKQISLGALVCFRAYNDKVGVKAPNIRLITRDDQLDPERTVALYREVATKEKPIAFMYPISPANIASVFGSRLPEALKTPLIGTLPSLQNIQGASNPYIFHLGQGADKELQVIIQHAATVGLRKIGLTYWDTPSAHEFLSAMESLSQKFGVTITIRAPRQPSGEADIGVTAVRLVNASPDAIVSLLPVNETARLVRTIREKNPQAIIYSMSFVESRLLWQWAGEDYARGVCLSQYLPNPYSSRYPLVAAYQAHMRKYASSAEGISIGTLTLEGYVAARVLLESIKLIKGHPTGESVRQSLESMRDTDLGGMVVSYSPERRVGLDYADIGIVTQDGRLVY